MNHDRSDQSMVVQLDHFVDQHTGAVVPPIHPSTTFARDNKYELVGGIRYGRYGNPSWSHVERSEEHTSELQSLLRISYAVFCLKNKKRAVEQLKTTILLKH